MTDTMSPRFSVVAPEFQPSDTIDAVPLTTPDVVCVSGVLDATVPTVCEDTF